jgi:hypothetical protein
MTTRTEGHDALDDLFWRAEILQAMYWMRGEGLAEDVEADALARFLAADPAVIAEQLVRLERDGYLEAVAIVRYRLTALGAAEGGRSFADEFEGLTHQAHYECAPGCWCQDPDHAEDPCPSHPEHPEVPPPDEPEAPDAV